MRPAIVCRLWCRPLDGEPRPHPRLVLVLLDEASKPKVRNLHNVVVANKHVASSQVPEKRQTHEQLEQKRPASTILTYECSSDSPDRPYPRQPIKKVGNLVGMLDYQSPPKFSKVGQNATLILTVSDGYDGCEFVDDSGGDFVHNDGNLFMTMVMTIFGMIQRRTTTMIMMKRVMKVHLC